MNGFCWRLVDLVSRTLAPDERNAVCGDFAESGVHGRQALRDLLSLVLRHQSVLSVALAIALGLIFGSIAKRAMNLTSIYAWNYLDNWTAGYLGPGFRTDLTRYLAEFCWSYLALACCAWTCGLLLRFVSRRTAGIDGLLFFLVLLFDVLPRAPGSHDPNGAVFSSIFYRFALPSLLLIVLAFVPALAGMRTRFWRTVQ